MIYFVKIVFLTISCNIVYLSAAFFKLFCVSIIIQYVTGIDYLYFE